MKMTDRPIDEDEELDSEEAFGDGDEEKFEGFAFRGSKKSKPNHKPKEEIDADADSIEDMEDDSEENDEVALSDENMPEDTASSSQEEDEEDDDDISSSSSSSPSTPPKAPSTDRALLRKMMADSQASVLSNITTAQKADASKGKAIKNQRSTFDALLNTRIKLQKALIATNSLQASPQPSPSAEADTATIHSAEQAALNLWNTLDSLLTTLQPLPPSKPTPPATPTTPTSTLQARTIAHTSTRLPHHRSTLTKWSQKINPAPLPSRSKFSQAPTQLPLTTILDNALTGASASKLLAKTRVPRSCAPVQAAAGLESAEGIYDDADFYTLLLRELVDQRMASTSQGGNGGGNGAKVLLPGMKDRALRVKKKVDTKASKGRKMRYTVHEKLMNFVAPDDRGTWGERQRAELFAGLLGRKVEMGEGAGSEESGDEERREEEGLMLFRRG